MFENDFLMRQIEMTARAIASAVFQKRVESELAEEHDELVIAEDDYNEYYFNKLVLEGKINEAENLLFAEILRVRSEKSLALALDFYARLNKMSDEQLTACDFSREEIAEGLEELKKHG